MKTPVQKKPVKQKTMRHAQIICLCFVLFTVAYSTYHNDELESKKYYWTKCDAIYIVLFCVQKNVPVWSAFLKKHRVYKQHDIWSV